MRWLLLLGCGLWVHGAWAQQERTLRVVDARTGEPLPYATVLVLGTARGTITNTEGHFSLPDGAPGDSLRISFVGYRSTYREMAGLRNGDRIPLERAQHQLREVTVRPDELIYKRVAAIARKLGNSPPSTGRLFFGMETHSDTSAVEMIHAYFNARFSGARLTDLTLKQGRIGIAPRNGRFYINYNTTRAFALMDIQADAGPYPHTPLRFRSAKDLKRGWYAELVSTGSGPDGVDHLRVWPRKHNPEAFTLELWVEPVGDRVRALELHCTTCPRHPFIPLFDHGRIDTVDLRYRQTWTATGPPLPEVLELTYRMAYTGPDFTETYRAHAVMHVFDRSAPFIEPVFTYTGDLPDYRKIGWLPEDTLFWQRMRPPLPTARQQRDMDFLLHHDVRAGPWYRGLGNDQNFFAAHYAIWSADHRVRLQAIATKVPTAPFTRVRVSELTGGHALYDGPLPVRLVAQLYLDMDTVQGRLIHRTATVLDGFQSFDLVADQAWNTAFHNIWFDLCELERRAMEERLNAPGLTLARALAIHAEHTRRLQATTDRFMIETHYGDLFEGLLPWNERVKKGLGIDNIAMFGL